MTSFDSSVLPPAITDHFLPALAPAWKGALGSLASTFDKAYAANQGGPLALATVVYLHMTSKLTSDLLLAADAAGLANRARNSDYMQAAIGNKPPLFFSYTLYAAAFADTHTAKSGGTFFGNDFISSPPMPLTQVQSMYPSLLSPSLDVAQCPARFYQIPLAVAMLCHDAVPVGAVRRGDTWSLLTAKGFREMVLGKDGADEVITGFFTEAEVGVVPFTPALLDPNLFEDDGATDWGAYQDRAPVATTKE